MELTLIQLPITNYQLPIFNVPRPLIDWQYLNKQW